MLRKFIEYIKRFLGKKEEHLEELILEETDVNNELVTVKKAAKKNAASANITTSRTTLLIWGVVLVIVCVTVTFFVADRLYFGGYFLDSSNKVSFDRESNDSYTIAKLQTVINQIESDFYPGVDRNVLVEGAIEGIVEALGDRYTVYYKPGTMNAFTEFITGSYEGIGTRLKSCDTGLEIVEVFAGSPAEKAGIAAGDILVAVNDETTVGMTNEKITELLGTSGNTLRLTVTGKDGKERITEVTVDKVNTQTVYVNGYESGIYHLVITKFDNDTGTEFYNKVTDAIDKGCRALVIDLRNNGGGFESQASMIADMLLPQGTIATAKDKNGKILKEIKSESSALDIPIVLLVNGNTASASELLAGAVRDFDKGELVGTKTFGKAVGQITLNFEQDGSGLVITTSCYYTPDGESIQGKGITPDFVVELDSKFTDTAVSDIPKEEDTQLQKAFELINAKLAES